MINKIISTDNNLIKKINKLINNVKFREQENIAVIYGEHLVEEAIKNNCLLDLLIHEELLEKYADIKQNLYVVNNAILNKLNRLDSEIRIIGLINTIKTSKTSIDKLYNQDVVILENIQDPNNLGAILRNIAAANVKNVCLSSNCVDLYNYKVIRASQGVQFGLNIFTHVNLEHFFLNYKGIIFGTSSHAKDTLYSQNMLVNCCAFVFGNEGYGISDSMLKLTTKNIKVPINPDVESLGIVSASAICLFEMVRQRLCL